MPRFRSVLVLGGSGFIGHHVVRELLDNGHEVRVLVRPGGNRSLLRPMPVEVVEGALEAPFVLERALRDCDALIHAAGYYPTYSINSGEQVWTGLKQINRIQSALKRSRCKRFVYVSAPLAVGHYEEGRPEDENAPYPRYRDRSTYARIKRAMQHKVLALNGPYDTVVVAPTGVFGEGDRKPTTGRVLLDVAKGHIPIRLKGKVNVVDVHDVAKGLVSALNQGNHGRLYVLGGLNTTLPEFLGSVGNVVGKKVPGIEIPPDVLRPLGFVSELAGRLTGRDTPFLPLVGLHFAKYGEHLSSDVAQQELGYQPTESIHPALERAWHWFQEHGYA